VRTPRNVSGSDLIKSLQALGYESSRQVDSHIRLTTQLDGEYHITVPNHAPLRLGTFKSTLKLVAVQHTSTVEELLEKLDL
jgi:predicted RNA binding protein YcfA (HicA-like mRNA interferase family)